MHDAYTITMSGYAQNRHVQVSCVAQVLHFYTFFKITKGNSDIAANLIYGSAYDFSITVLRYHGDFTFLIYEHYMAPLLSMLKISKIMQCSDDLFILQYPRHTLNRKE